MIDVCLKNIIIIYYSSDKYHDINKRNKQLYFRQALLDELFCLYNRRKLLGNIKYNNHLYIKALDDKYVTCEIVKLKETKEDKEIIPGQDINVIIVINSYVKIVMMNYINKIIYIIF